MNEATWPLFGSEIQHCCCSNTVTLSWILSWCSLFCLRVLCPSSPAWTALLWKQRWWVTLCVLEKQILSQGLLCSHLIIMIIWLITCCSLSGPVWSVLVVAWHSCDATAQLPAQCGYQVSSRPYCWWKISIHAVFRLQVKCLQHRMLFQQGKEHIPSDKNRTGALT